MDNQQRARAILQLAAEAAEHQAIEFEAYRAGRETAVDQFELTEWFADWQHRLRLLARQDAH